MNKVAVVTDYELIVAGVKALWEPYAQPRVVSWIWVPGLLDVPRSTSSSTTRSSNHQVGLGLRKDWHHRARSGRHLWDGERLRQSTFQPCPPSSVVRVRLTVALTAGAQARAASSPAEPVQVLEGYVDQQPVRGAGLGA